MLTTLTIAVYLTGAVLAVYSTYLALSFGLVERGLLYRSLPRGLVVPAAALVEVAIGLGLAWAYQATGSLWVLMIAIGFGIGFGVVGVFNLLKVSEVDMHE